MIYQAIQRLWSRTSEFHHIHIVYTVVERARITINTSLYCVTCKLRSFYVVCNTYRFRIGEYYRKLKLYQQWVLQYRVTWMLLTFLLIIRLTIRRFTDIGVWKYSVMWILLNFLLIMSVTIRSFVNLVKIIPISNPTIPCYVNLVETVTCQITFNIFTIYNMSWKRYFLNK
jgi:hypothetical protein